MTMMTMMYGRDDVDGPWQTRYMYKATNIQCNNDTLDRVVVAVTFNYVCKISSAS